MVEKVCKICGKPFTAVNGRQQICSAACRIESGRLRQLKFQNAHREENLAAKETILQELKQKDMDSFREHQRRMREDPEYRHMVRYQNDPIYRRQWDAEHRARI